MSRLQTGLSIDGSEFNTYTRHIIKIKFENKETKTCQSVSCVWKGYGTFYWVIICLNPKACVIVVGMYVASELTKILWGICVVLYPKPALLWLERKTSISPVWLHNKTVFGNSSLLACTLEQWCLMYSGLQIMKNRMLVMIPVFLADYL